MASILRWTPLVGISWRPSYQLPGTPFTWLLEGVVSSTWSALGFSSRGCAISQAWSLSSLLECGFPLQWNLPFLSLYPKPHKRKELPKSLHLAPLSQFPTAMRSSSAVWLPCIQQDSIANVCILLESGWYPRSAWFQYSLAIFFQVILGPFQSRVQGLNPGAWDMFRQVGSYNLSFLHHWVRIAMLNSLAGAVNRPEQPGVSEWEGDSTYQVKPCSLRDKTSRRSQSLPGSHRWGVALPLANCPQSTLCWWRQGWYLFTLQ